MVQCMEYEDSVGEDPTMGHGSEIEGGKKISKAYPKTSNGINEHIGDGPEREPQRRGNIMICPRASRIGRICECVRDTCTSCVGVRASARRVFRYSRFVGQMKHGNCGREVAA